MSIPLNDNIKVQAPKPSDERYLNDISVPFASLAEANLYTIGRRHIGLTVNVNNEEYWYADGILDVDLVVKIPVVDYSSIVDALGYIPENIANKGVPNGYTPLDSNAKVPLIHMNDAVLGNVNYQGLWDQNTNTPTLTTTVETKGHYYVCSGLTPATVFGLTFNTGDWIISNGTTWEKVDNTDAVSTVFGRTGNIIATLGDYNTGLVTEVSNKNYQTDLQKLYNDATSSIQTQLNSKQPLLTNPITGTGVNGQVAFFTGTTTQTSDSNFIWDNSNKKLTITNGNITIGTVISNGRLDIDNTFAITVVNTINSNGFDVSNNVFSNVGTLTQFSLGKIVAGTSLQRWIIRCDGASETGSDVGSDFRLLSRHDDGSVKSDIIAIKRSTGNIGININPTTVVTDKLQVNGNITALAAVNANQVVIKSQLDAAIPTSYSKTIYVNSTDPNSATVFDDENPPTTNDNTFKADVSNIYIGTNTSTWIYSSASLNYIPTVVTASTSNFYLPLTTIDAGNTKTADIARVGGMTIGSTASIAARLAVVGASATAGNAVEVQNLSGTKILQIGNNGAFGFNTNPVSTSGADFRQLAAAGGNMSARFLDNVGTAYAQFGSGVGLALNTITSLGGNSLSINGNTSLNLTIGNPNTGGMTFNANQANITTGIKAFYRTIGALVFTGSGTATWNGWSYEQSIDLTAAATKLARAYYINPTLIGFTGNEFIAFQSVKGGVFVNTTTPQASAILQTDSTTQGTLPFPRMTSTQRLAITSPAEGLYVYQTNAPIGLWQYTSGVWLQVTGNSITGTATSGQVSFWNGTNTQTGDSSFIWDNTNKRLGINTPSPTELLEVGGNIKATSFIKVGAAVTDLLLGTGGNFSTNSIYQLRGSYGSGGQSVDTLLTSGIWLLSTSSTGIKPSFTIRNLLVFKTTEPTATFITQVGYHETTGRTATRSSNDTGATWSAWIESPTGSGTTNYITKWTTSLTQGISQLIDNGTNVGIGVTPTLTVTDKLQVNGNITANAATVASHVVIKSQLDALDTTNVKTTGNQYGITGDKAIVNSAASPSRWRAITTVDATMEGMVSATQSTTYAGFLATSQADTVAIEVQSTGLNSTGLLIQPSQSTPRAGRMLVLSNKKAQDLVVDIATPLTILRDGVTVTSISDLGAIKATSFALNALNTAPASATATGILGEIRFDASYMYVCTATNTWKRSAIITW